MKLTSKQINSLLLSIGIFAIIFLRNVFERMETPHNVVMSIYFVIGAFMIYLLYLKFKSDEDKKQTYLILAIVSITLLIILAVYFYFIQQ